MPASPRPGTARTGGRGSPSGSSAGRLTAFGDVGPPGLRRSGRPPPRRPGTRPADPRGRPLESRPPVPSHLPVRTSSHVLPGSLRRRLAAGAVTTLSAAFALHRPRLGTGRGRRADRGGRRRRVDGPAHPGHPAVGHDPAAEHHCARRDGRDLHRRGCRRPGPDGAVAGPAHLGPQWRVDQPRRRDRDVVHRQPADLQDSGNRYRAVLSSDAGYEESAPATLTVTGTAPSKPQGVVARQTGTGEVTLTWSAPTSHGDSAISSYEPGWSGGSSAPAPRWPPPPQRRLLGPGDRPLRVLGQRGQPRRPGERTVASPLLVLGPRPALAPSRTSSSRVSG